MSPERRLWTVRELAEALDVSPAEIKRTAAELGMPELYLAIDELTALRRGEAVRGDGRGRRFRDFPSGASSQAGAGRPVRLGSNPKIRPPDEIPDIGNNSDESRPAPPEPPPAPPSDSENAVTERNAAWDHPGLGKFRRPPRLDHIRGEPFPRD